MCTSETKTITVPNNLREAIIHFADPIVCHEFMTAMRWSTGVACPRCGDTAVGFVKTRRIWNCKGCKKQFSVKVGTIFEDSPLGLEKWLIAIWFITNAKNGISSCEVARALDVTQKTAWFMLHRIRLMLQTGSMEKFNGEVEADETYIGGKAKNMHYEVRKRKIRGRGASGKTIVAGVLERGEVWADTETGEIITAPSQVRVKVVPNTSAQVLGEFVTANVEEGSAFYTDALPSYRVLADRYGHAFVDHTISQYVNGAVYTNGMENFWSVLKRGLKGTYVSTSPAHLWRYLDEQAFRFNNRLMTGDKNKERKQGDSLRFLKAIGGVSGKRLTYQALILK